MQNTREQTIKIATYLNDNIDNFKGAFEIELYNGLKSTLKILSLETKLATDLHHCIIKTFTIDINDISTYNVYDIKSIKPASV